LLGRGREGGRKGEGRGLILPGKTSMPHFEKRGEKGGRKKRELAIFTSYQRLLHQ